MQICLLWDEFLGVSCLRYINACNVELPTFTHSTAISSPKPHQRLCSSYFWPWCRYFQLWIHFYALSLSQCKLVAVVNTIFLIVSDSITKYSTSPLLDLKAPFHQTTTESLLFHVRSNLIFKHCPFLTVLFDTTGYSSRAFTGLSFKLLPWCRFWGSYLCPCPCQCWLCLCLCPYFALARGVHCPSSFWYFGRLVP